jgi:hypothetical protein
MRDFPGNLQSTSRPYSGLSGAVSLQPPDFSGHGLAGYSLISDYSSRFVALLRGFLAKHRCFVYQNG